MLGKKNSRVPIHGTRIAKKQPVPPETGSDPSGAENALTEAALLGATRQAQRSRGAIMLAWAEIGKLRHMVYSLAEQAGVSREMVDSEEGKIGDEMAALRRRAEIAERLACWVNEDRPPPIYYELFVDMAFEFGGIKDQDCDAARLAVLDYLAEQEWEREHGEGEDG